MRKPLRLALLLALATSSACAQGRLPASPPPSGRPRLVLVISIDQFRPDFLTRFEPHYLPATGRHGVGGFRYLMERGANFRDASHAHVPTATGPGHAAILTGCGPALHGIVGNEWFDRATGKMVYCVQDPSVETIGGKSGPMSPATLLGTTVGDELKVATNGQAKVVGIAFKDRAAILMAGHAADTVVWFDSGTGNWVTSTHYAPSKRLPAWVEALNAEGRPRAELARQWTPLLDNRAYAQTRRAPFVKDAPQDRPFAHALTSIRDWTISPLGQQYVFDTVERALDAEGLGKDEVPDLLAMNLSTNDYIGHAFGPNSPEAMDISVHTDRMLSRLLNTLERKVPGGLSSVTIVLTADHGVLPIVEEMAAYRLPGKRYGYADVRKAVDAALSKTHGEAKWVLANAECHVYLNRSLIVEKGLRLEEIERQAAEAAMAVPGVQLALTRTQILNGQIPDWPWARLAAQSYHPRLSGDLIFLEAPGNYFGEGTGTGHGSAWAYDRHVPLILCGAGIRPGTYARPVVIPDLAPTLSLLLGVGVPSASIGTPLREALEVAPGSRTRTRR